MLLRLNKSLLTEYIPKWKNILYKNSIAVYFYILIIPDHGTPVFLDCKIIADLSPPPQQFFVKKRVHREVLEAIIATEN